MSRSIARLITLCLASAAVSWAAPALAADDSSHHAMESAQMSSQASGNTSAPSSQAYEDASQKMHRSMSMDYSGNADVDFVRGMIAHHQGAIDMAKVELKYGKDNEMRRLAERIINAQQGEIKLMKRWLEANQAEQGADH
ncbi:CopM family metallochaperone [Carnimonas bestiolae]|uniref:CopM family metallochaperone n=1 Tax=Carnimonas bestiolae TaxID=3402172 RepID=UPI003F4A9F9B